jgi:hypothetical protein
MSNARWQILLVAAVFAGAGFTGCATVDQTAQTVDQTAQVVQEDLKAKPSQGAGFVPVDQMSKREDLPFNKVWVQAGVDFKAYRTVYIKPVNTKYLLQANWWQQNFRQDDYANDVQNVANYMRQKFIEAFQNDPNQRFKVLQKPQRGSLTIELALTELVPSNVVLEAAGYAPEGIGLGVKVVERATGADSTVAFEARIVDSKTGKILAMAADREAEQIAPVNLRGLTWYGVAHGIIDTWAQQFVDIANKQPGEVIKDTSPFTLKIW